MAQDTTLPASVFLSYSSSDKSEVVRLANDLKRRGVKVWLDEWQIRVGDSITQEVETGLRDSDCVAIWLTRNSVKSGWVQKEWQSKFSGEIASGKVAVLPLLAEPCEIGRASCRERVWR